MKQTNNKEGVHTFYMKTKDLQHVHTGLSTENRKSVIERLNILLADEHLLYTKTRNYHWNVTGIHFAAMHELFEQQYNRLKLMADNIAERTRMLGGTAAGSMSEFLELTRLSETPGDVPSTPDMLANLLGDHEEIISNVRKDIEKCAEEFGDEGSADLLTAVMRDHEEMAWMLRSSQESSS